MDEYNLIRKLELELVKPETRRNIDRLSELISGEFEEYGSSGKCYRKKDILDLLPQENEKEFRLIDFKFKKLSSCCILVKYKSIANGSVALRSSIWTKDKGKWQIIHHQATLTKKRIL